MSYVVPTGHCLAQMVGDADEIVVFIATCSRHIHCQVKIDKVLLLAAVSILIPKESD